MKVVSIPFRIVQDTNIGENCWTAAAQRAQVCLMTSDGHEPTRNRSDIRAALRGGLSNSSLASRAAGPFLDDGVANRAQHDHHRGLSGGTVREPTIGKNVLIFMEDDTRQSTKDLALLIP